MHQLMRYLERWAEPAPVVPLPANADLRLAVVIPCMDEPDLLALMRQLRQQALALPRQTVEIIVVVNHPEGANPHTIACNRETADALRRFAKEHDEPGLHVVEACALPRKQAGVGLARKIGMDAAVRRFAAIDRPDGIIASLDADCLVAEDYLSAMLDWFAAHPNAHAATLDFAHRIEEVHDPRQRQAIIGYEIFLRYMVTGWQYAGLPYAFAAIGSCFAVRANAYARHHGMNKRQAGEDFYFLHKLARERPLGTIDKARVYPSARMSQRTPFGTGRAVADFCRSEQPEWLLPGPDAFADLRMLTRHLGLLYADGPDALCRQVPARLAGHLATSGLASAYPGMRQHAASLPSFAKRFFAWFDGLKAWRYVHQNNPRMPVFEALPQLMRLLGGDAEAASDEAWLIRLRELR